MWYYTENGEQRGPVTDADLDALAQAGKISYETLVWREGMADWQPYGTAKPGATGTVPPQIAQAGADDVFCAECGNRFPAGEVMKYNGVNVCASCKPIFVQKLREGVNVGGVGVMNYASFLLRLGAYLLDSIILFVVARVIGFMGFLLGGALSEPGQAGAISPIQLVTMAIMLVIQLSYYTFFLGKYGATPGKMACGIKVVNADGSPISYAKGAARFLGYFISSLICFIGFFIMLGDSEKRTLHDRICNTRVIKK